MRLNPQFIFFIYHNSSYALQNNMGHLMIEEFKTTPENIRKFANDKIKNKINYATDNKKLGCRFYILRSGLAPTHTYYMNGDSITLDFNRLDEFKPHEMIYLI